MEWKNFVLEFGKILYHAEIKQSFESYWTGALMAAAFAAAFSWLSIDLVLNNIFLGGILAGFVFVLAVTIAYLYPISKKKEIAGKIEKDLPEGLIGISIDLNLGTTFEEALENAAKADFGLFSKYLGFALEKIKTTNIGVEEALKRMAKKIDSVSYKRATKQLINAYKNAGKSNGGITLRKLAMEQMQMQKAAIKEFAGKITIYSLLFIVVAAIMPGMFMAVITVMTAFMEFSLSPELAFVIVTIVFPLLDFIILQVIVAKTPLFMRG